MNSFGVFTTNMSNSKRIIVSRSRTGRDHLFALSFDSRNLLYIPGSSIVQPTNIILVNENRDILFNFNVIGRYSNAFILQTFANQARARRFVNNAVTTLQNNNAFIQNIFFEDDEGDQTDVISGFFVFE